MICPICNEIMHSTNNYFECENIMPVPHDVSFDPYQDRFLIYKNLSMGFEKEIYYAHISDTTYIGPYSSLLIKGNVFNLRTSSYKQIISLYNKIFLLL